jgi:hypothetical protein
LIVGSTSVPKSIGVAQLKTQPLSVALGILDQAKAAGMSRIDVLNRGRPIFHLSHQDELPRVWAGDELEPLPHVDLRKGKISLSKLRKEGKAFLLTQRFGPSLVLWPLEDDYARPPEVATADRLDALERAVQLLRRRLKKLEEASTKRAGQTS